MEGTASLQSEALRRADQFLVGGVLGGAGPPRELSMVAARGLGSHIWDLDGREYIDFVMGSGPLILGHAHPAVVKAAAEQISLGSHYYVVNEPGIKLAEEIVLAVPCAEKLRFTSSGSEAAFYALRLARAHTGRDKILKFEGAYHGHQDHTMMSVNPKSPGGYPGAKPDSAGIPRSLVEETLVAPFNDTEATLAIIERNAHALAAVIIEPCQRLLRPKPGFLQSLRTITKDLGIVLVFDEIVTGFRLSYGGAQEFYGVTPDLAALGKIIGGGFPLGAVVGRADIMDLCDPRRKGSPSYVFFSGTLSGNPVGAAAGLATLAELRRAGSYERLRELGDRMRNGLAAVAADRGIPAQVIGEGTLYCLLFTQQPVETYSDLLSVDGRLGVQIGTEMLRRGLFVRPGEKGYLCLAHTDEEIDHYLATVGELLDVMRPMGAG